MITRSKLVEQLRDNQIRSQHKFSVLTIFSHKPYISTWVDIAVAIFWAFLFGMLIVSCYATLYLRRFWFAFVIICLGIYLPICLKISRQVLIRKREKRLLPLSM